MEASLFALYREVPISALNASCRWKLSESLNSEMPLASDAGYPRSWEGMAELIGLKFNRIKLLKQKPDPTAALIELWEENPGATVGKLIDYLQIMERYDVQEDIEIFVERDGRKYLREQEEERLRLEARNPVQDPQVSSGDPVEWNMTVQEVMEPSMETDERMSYDAYVSYAETDVDFVLKLIEELEGKHGLRLFIKDRDMLAGLLESEAQIKMMHERCERILLVLSPEFLNDPKCEFQTVIAQAIQVEKNMYSRKVIPIIYKTCDLPVRLRYIANLDYAKQDKFGSFWIRLYTSITKANHKGGSVSDTGTYRLPLPSSARSMSIQSSSSTSMLTDIDQSSSSMRQAPAVMSDRLSPSLTQDSGIFMSLRSASMSDGLDTVEPINTGDTGRRKGRKSSTQRLLSVLKFNSGNSGHISN